MEGKARLATNRSRLDMKVARHNTPTTSPRDRPCGLLGTPGRADVAATGALLEVNPDFRLTIRLAPAVRPVLVLTLLEWGRGGFHCDTKGVFGCPGPGGSRRAVGAARRS